MVRIGRYLGLLEKGQKGLVIQWSKGTRRLCRRDQEWRRRHLYVFFSRNSSVYCKEGRVMENAHCRYHCVGDWEWVIDDTFLSWVKEWIYLFLLSINFFGTQISATVVLMQQISAQHHNFTKIVKSLAACGFASVKSFFFHVPTLCRFSLTLTHLFAGSVDYSFILTSA